MTSPVTADEARARAAWFFHRTGRADRAQALVDRMSTAPGEPKVRYLTDLIRGEVRRAQGQREAAAASFRDALAVWPDAQSARIALMTLLIEQGSYPEAERLAVEVQTAPPDLFDPWWLYWLGDSSELPQRLAALRGLIR